ncbi:MAG: tRNA adenosine(34) deaminase TadA [Firmicutes bacterium]|nr:tRNA adenosine(34) deaminase TadA [Bacillota bacterium]MDY3659247.1 tRNA adenosine(34) deaminase TadA [Eubacteriales bacterium]
MENKFMEEALKLAQKANKKGEVPIGAVIVRNGKIISKGFNKREKTQNAIMHAEIVAIEKACKKLRSWRLDDCEIYVTLEPCLMCLGAIINSRIKKLVFGASDNKSYTKEFLLSKNNSLNHNLEIESGILEEDCAKLLKEFFKNARKNIVK